VKTTCNELFSFKFPLRKKERFQNSTNFPFVVGAKELKSNPKIIINEIDLR
jgi:hypothetical protein